MATNRHKKFISSHIEGLVTLKEKRSPVRFYTPSSPPPFKYPPLPGSNDNDKYNMGKNSKSSPCSPPQRITNISPIQHNSPTMTKTASQNVRIPTPVHITPSIQATNAIEILRKQVKRIYSHKLKQLISYICDTMEKAMYYKDAPLLITYKDVLKGIELSLNNHVGKVKKTCLILEKENDIIKKKLNNKKMDTLSTALRVEQINKHIRELKASIERARIRTKEATEEQRLIFEQAMEKEESAHTSKSRAEAFEQNSFALHDQIYEAQNLKKQLELDQRRMFTLDEYNKIQEELESKKAYLKELKTTYENLFNEFESDSKKASVTDCNIVKMYEDQENSTVELYTMRETHTPRPILDEDTVLKVAKKKFIKLANDLEQLTARTGDIVTEEINSSGLLSGIFRKLYILLHKNSQRTRLLRIQMDFAMLLGNQPGTSDFVDMMASLSAFTKTITLANESISLRENYYEYINAYKKEKAILDEVAEKIISDDKRAKKHGLHTLKITKLNLKNGVTKKYAKIIGRYELPRYLQVVDVETLAKNILPADKAFLKQIENDEKEEHFLNTSDHENATLVENNNSSNSNITINNQKKGRKSDILSNKKGNKNVLQDVSRLLEIIPIGTIDELLELIEEIYNFQNILKQIMEGANIHKEESIHADVIASVVQNDQNLNNMEAIVHSFFRSKYPNKNKRYIGTWGASLLYACTQFLYDVRIRTFYYVLTCQVPQQIEIGQKSLFAAYRKHINQISLMEGHYGQGIVWKKNVIASFGRFFPQFNNVQLHELERRILLETPWSVLDTNKLFTMRYPTEANAPLRPSKPISPKKKKRRNTKHKEKKVAIVVKEEEPVPEEKPKDSFLHFLAMMYLEANRKYYLTFRDKLSIANPIQSPQIAVPLVRVALIQADSFLTKSLLNLRLADILGVKDVKALANHMFNPSGESPTKFIDRKVLCTNLLCHLNFFPTRFFNKEYEESKPCIVYDTSTCYTSNPLSEDETIRRILFWSTVYNDGKRTKVIATKADNMMVNMITARRIIGYEGIETRTPKRKIKKKEWANLNKKPTAGKDAVRYNDIQSAMIKWMVNKKLRKKKRKTKFIIAKKQKEKDERMQKLANIKDKLKKYTITKKALKEYKQFRVHNLNAKSRNINTGISYGQLTIHEHDDGTFSYIDEDGTTREINEDILEKKIQLMEELEEVRDEMATI